MAAAVCTEMSEKPSLTLRIQRRFEELYGVEAPSVDSFVEETDGSREVLEVCEQDDAVEMRLHLPKSALARETPLTIDLLSQVAEGVSHFLYLAERARRELPATQLELELQAEVDKFLLLSGSLATGPGDPPVAPPVRSRGMRARLFEDVRYLHPEGTEHGDRYRLANQLASRFALKLERAFERGIDAMKLKGLLRTFFAAGQREKIEMVLAA